MKLIKFEDSASKMMSSAQICPRCNGSGKTELLRTIPTNAEVIIDVYGKLYLKCSVCNKNEV
jgi:formate dehydrogenase maturation protein FdhE